MTISHILFDLDNTLYPSTSGIMPMFDVRIAEYVRNFLHLNEEEAQKVRESYFSTYGTTLRGLQLNYGDTVDVEDYLHYIHDMEISAFLALDAELDTRLGGIATPKSIFTNSPIEHAQRVLKALGIERHFAQIFDLRYHAFDPKPSLSAYERVVAALGVPASQLAFVEDTPQNLVPAHLLGMTTILLRDEPSDPDHPLADYVVPDILAALGVLKELEG